MSQPEQVINHSGVAPEPVDLLEGINLPTAGRGPSLVERIRGMVRGVGGSFNPRMIALFIGGVILFLVALGLFVKQSPAKAAGAGNTGPMKPVEVKRQTTYKSSPPVVAAAKDGSDEHSVQEHSSGQSEQSTSTSGGDAEEVGQGRSRERAEHHPGRTMEDRSPVFQSTTDDGSRNVAEAGLVDKSSAGGSGPAQNVALARHYAVDYEASLQQPPKAETSAKEDAVVLLSDYSKEPGSRSANGSLLVIQQGQQQQQHQQGTVLPRGLRIKMELLDPFQSGLSAMVRARVLEDVRLKDGMLLVPANSEVYLPMLELAVATPDHKGRVVVNPKPSEDEMGFITIGEDSRIMLKGTAYGADNLAGLPGKRTKVDGGPRFSALKRIAGRASGTLSSMSPVPLYGIESEIDRGSYSYERTAYIVNVPAHTKFTFVVGL